MIDGCQEPLRFAESGIQSEGAVGPRMRLVHVGTLLLLPEAEGKVLALKLFDGFALREIGKRIGILRSTI